MMSKPVSGTPRWSLLQSLPPGSCLESSPLTFSVKVSDLNPLHVGAGCSAKHSNRKVTESVMCRQSVACTCTSLLGALDSAGELSVSMQTSLPPSPQALDLAFLQAFLCDQYFYHHAWIQTHGWKHTSGCFQKGFTMEERPTLNAGGVIPRFGAETRRKVEVI